MPRPPLVAPRVLSLRGSPYSALAERASSFDGEVCPLHVGDTWMEPAPGCRMEDLRVEEHPGMHRYTSVHGMPSLVDTIVEHTRARTGLPVGRDEVLVTAGATGGLGVVAATLLAPGDEVLLLAPYWPLIEGIVRSVGGEPVAVPFFGAVGSVEEAVETVRHHVGPRTVALYVNTPSNPTGRVLPEPWLAALAELARAEGLWLLSDEVYEDYAYVGEHVPLRPMAPERTISAHSFSKAYGMAGNRAGYLVGPADVLRQACKIGTHTFYSTPTASQIAARRALSGLADGWVREARALYARVGAEAAGRLGVPAPEGGTFLFVDVAPCLDHRGLGGFLEDLADEGVFVAPGDSFGPYPTHVRICFTAAPPERTLRGVEKIARRMGR